MTTRGEGGLSPSVPLPTTGAVRLRVRYCECDPFGVAHHASYAPWLEIARTEMLRQGGVTYRQMEQAGVFLVIARMEISYRRPIRYDDEIDVRTRVVGGSRVKLEHSYEIARAAAAEVLTIAATTLVCVDARGGVRPLPEWLMAERHTPRG
ncbi:MAG: acyl-CoA thioesterase [Phycisphaerales bacterium]|nr:acyl-CoA thioesterase [Phycisphaerales bacterium]